MNSLMPSETPSPSTSSTSSSSRRAGSASFFSNASASSGHDLMSPPNSRASSSSMHNHNSSFMSRSSISSVPGQLELHTPSSPFAASSSSSKTSLGTPTREERRRKVVGISVAKSNLANEDFYLDKFLSGDIVQRVTVSQDYYFTSPFPAGKRGLLEELHNIHESGVSVLTIQVKRGDRQITRRALIVPAKKKHKYLLQDFEDPTHIFSFDDFTLESCSVMQDQGLKLVQEQLSKMRVAAVDVPYPWEQRMQSADGFSMVYSMLVVPRAHTDVHMSRSSTLEDAVLQAIAWLHGSKASGVPLIFRSIQTEPIISEDLEQSSNVDLSSIVSSGAYSVQQPQGFTDRRIVIRAVRMWFAFHVNEVKVELEATQGEALLGVTIGRTIEGFCYVTEVVPQTAAYRVGLKERLDAAKALGMKLVVTKVGNEQVLPWFMSNGKIRCYDINSISSKLSAHRRAGQAVCMHFLDIRETSLPTVSQVPGSMSTSSFGIEGIDGTYMDL